MINNHPIIPSTELLDQWCMDPELDGWRGIAIQAAQWGADQELQACCERLSKITVCMDDLLHAARRPKPPSLKEQALGLLNEGPVSDLLDHEVDTIRRALNELPDN